MVRGGHRWSEFQANCSINWVQKSPWCAQLCNWLSCTALPLPSVLRTVLPLPSVLCTALPLPSVLCARLTLRTLHGSPSILRTALPSPSVLLTDLYKLYTLISTRHNTRFFSRHWNTIHYSIGVASSVGL